MKRYTLPQFAAALNKMAADVRGRTLEKAVMNGARVVEAQAKLNATDKLNRHSDGALAASIQTTLETAEADRAVAAVGPTVKYGRIHELGGFIEARGKYLAIPVNAKKGTRPRDYPNLRFVGKPGAESAVMLDDAGVVMFALKKKVFLPARPYLRPALDEHTNEIITAIGEALRIEIEGAI